MEIRPFEEADAASVVRLSLSRDPHEIVTEGGILYDVRNAPARERRRDWVAVSDGELVGWGIAGFNWAVPTDEKGWVYLVVAPSHWDTAGAGLFDLGVEYVRSEGARELRCWLADPEGRELLEERGLVDTRGTLISAVDPREVDRSGLASLEASRAAEGFRLAPLAAVDDARAVHAVYATGEADMPGDEHEIELEYEPWVAETLEHPDLSHEGSFLVMHGERPVALAFFELDPARSLGYNEMTATLPEFRRRGLALLTKLAVTGWAAENGVERVLTENDDDNPGMLALNERLGYEVVHRKRQYFRKL